MDRSSFCLPFIFSSHSLRFISLSERLLKDKSSSSSLSGCWPANYFFCWSTNLVPKNGSSFSREFKDSPDMISFWKLSYPICYSICYYSIWSFLESGPLWIFIASSSWTIIGERYSLCDPAEGALTSFESRLSVLRMFIFFFECLDPSWLDKSSMFLGPKLLLAVLSRFMEEALDWLLAGSDGLFVF